MIRNGCLGGKKFNTHKWCERWGPLHCEVYPFRVCSSDGSKQFFFSFPSPSEDYMWSSHSPLTATKQTPWRKTTKMHLQASKSLGGGDRETIKLSHGRGEKMCLRRAAREALGHWRQSSVKSFIVVHGVRGYLEASVCSEWAFTCLSAPLEQAEYLEERTANALRTEATSCAFLPVFLSASVWRRFELPAVILDHRWLETLH